MTSMIGRPVVRIDDETTADDLRETLGHLNTAAKALSRRGPVGTMSAEYAAAHGRIDALLDELESRA